MPPFEKHEAVGKQVIDSDGIEVGYVIDANDRFLKVDEGPLGSISLGTRFVQMVTDKVVLNGPVSGIFTGLNVVDSAGEFVGVVRDTVESGDILDSLILENEEGGMLVVVMEDISLIDEWVELRLTSDELQERQ